MQRAIEQAVTHILKRMKVWQKLSFLGVVFLIPLAIFSYKMIASMRAMGVNFAQRETLGIEYLLPLQSLVEDVQQYRDLAAGLLNGDPSFAEKLAAKRDEIRTDIQLINIVDKELGATLDVTAHWEALRATLSHLLDATVEGKAQENFEHHTKLIKELLSFLVYVGDQSKLTLDPELENTSLIELFVYKLPQLAETVSQARGVGVGVAVRKSKTDDERVKLAKLSALIEVRVQDLQQELTETSERKGQLRVGLEALEQSLLSGEGKLSGVLASQLAATAALASSASEHFHVMTNPLTHSYELARQIGPLLQVILRARMTQLSWELYSVIMWMFVGLIVVTLIGLVVVRNITDPLRRAVRVAEQIAVGDLSVTLPTDDRMDEFGVLMQSFQRMTKSLQDVAAAAERIAQGDLTVTVQPQSHKDTMGLVLSKLVQNLRDITQQIHSGVDLLSATTSEILAATAQVAASAAQTASAVTETAATVEQVKQTSLVASQKAKTVAESAQVTVQVSRTGEQSVEKAVNRMEKIREQMESIADSVIKLGEQSRAIGDIITSVGDIADQSNLLAVNAAIEAANAGEHGKGFGVVAQEVRTLAEQSKQATAQVRTILSDIQKATNVAVMVTEQGTKAVESGVAQSLEAGGSIRMLAKSMAEATQAVMQIAASSQQQALGMDQVVIAVDSIKEASNQNVTSMTQVEKGMHHLLELGQRLQQLVGRYKLNSAAARA
jgi:methyl-accepting chemotaxis protein